ncbi:MAG: DNA-directed RNA polymerase subunit alpha C-terminal domain-containing protein [Christensenellales bacterium]
MIVQKIVKVVAMDKNFIEGELYSRKDVHDILSPDTNFTQGNGTWGLQGIVRIQPDLADYVLFVTYGREQSGHKFDETIHSNGTFEWQSQPSQRISDKVIQELIHSENNSIYLFLRENKLDDYKYMGKLKYVRHEPKRECPVYFTWKIVNESKNSISADDSIEILNLSTRTFNCLMRHGYRTIKAFMKLTEEICLKTKNLGRLSIYEILMKQQELIEKYDILAVCGIDNFENGNRDEIKNLNLSLRAKNVLINNKILSLKQFAQLKEKEIRGFLHCGELTVIELICKQKEVIRDNLQIQIELLKGKIDEISEDNYNILIEDVFNNTIAYALRNKGIFKLGDLCKLYVDNSNFEDLDILYLVKSLESFKFPFKQLIYNNLLEIIKKPKKDGTPNKEWMRDLTILNNRALGQTLLDSGRDYALTRERVRQLEKQTISKFQNAYYFGKFEIYLKSFFKKSNYAFSNNFKNSLNELSNLFIFILKEGEFSNLHYYKDYDLFIIGNDWVENYKEIISKLPDIILFNEINVYIEKIQNKLKLNDVHIEKQDIEILFKIDFSNKYGAYSKNRITNSDKYEIVLQKNYPNGIDIYDENQMQEFIRLCGNIFSSEDLNYNIRAVGVRVASICIPIGRGIYGLKSMFLKSRELIEPIYDFIMKSDREVFATGGLYLRFEDLLKGIGVKNRYYLHGILKEYYGNNLYFKRDYIYKDRSSYSIKEEVINFIKSANEPLSKNQIREVFPGVSDATLQNYLTEKGILNYFGKYIHIDNLDITAEDIEFVRNIINNLVSDNKIHHTNELFTVLSIKYNSFIDKCGIKYQYMLFSVIEELFEFDYEWKRPYFARKGIEIPDEYERIKSFVSLYDEITIDKIKYFANSQGIGISSILDMVNSLNEEFIFKDEKTLIRTDKFFKDESDAIQAIDIIERVVSKNGIFSAASINTYYMFPEGYEWNQWIIYSLIKKYSDKVNVFTSSRQFRSSHGKVESKVIFTEKKLNISSYVELIDYLNGIGIHGNGLLNYMRENRLD